MRFPSLYGVWLQWHPLDLTFWLSALGLYGHFHTRCLKQMPNDALFLDIGANQGLFSAIVQKRGIPVIAFEPNPTRFADLVTNLHINRGHDAIPLCAAVTGDKPDLMDLHIPRFHSGAASLVKSSKGRCITALTLGQEFFDRIAAEHAGPVWVKVDVEGAELSVLTALHRSTLGPQIDGLIIECSYHHHDEHALIEVRETLEWMGLTHIDEHRVGRHGDQFFRRVDSTVTQSQPNCHQIAI